MPRGDQISRQWQILQILEASKMGVSVPEIAGKLSANVRTIYRDMEALELAGFPIYNEGDGGAEKWKFVDGYRCKMPIPLELTEVMSLMLARDHLKAFEGTSFSSALNSAFDKIRATLKPEAHAFLSGLSNSFRVGIGGKRDYNKHAATIELINKALIDRLSIDIRYKDDKAKRTIDPYHVWFMGGTIYIVAYCHTRKAVRLFVLDRIKKAAITDNKFSIPSDFSMDKFSGNRFRVIGGDGLTKVRIRFNKDLAEYIKEWTWHPSQTIEAKRNGSIILTMNIEGLFEVKNWVMSFGKRAKVLEPTKLAKAIQKESLTVAKLYK
jgi:predicted DNA-binding transcriptional regulator YafY